LRLLTWAAWLLCLGLCFLWDLIRGLVQGFTGIDAQERST